MARARPLIDAAPSAAREILGRRIILVLWLIAELVVLALAAPRVLETRLRDTDDYMRFVEVFDWLDGAGWRDVRQHRLDPPAGVEMHWARLPDLPLAAVVAVTEPWLGRTGAAMAAALVVPALTLLGVVLAVGWVARPILGRGAAPLAVLIALLMPIGLVQLLPGRVDHHGWQNLLALIALGALLRLLILPQRRSAALVAAAAFAAGLWIGAEAVPWLAAFTLVLAAAWTWRGDATIKAGGRTALALFGFTVVLFFLVRPWGEWFVPACDGFSIAQTGLAAAVLVFWGGLWLTARRAASFATRFGAAAGWGVASLAGWLAVFPDCLAGPYGPLDPQFTALLIDHTRESMTVFRITNNNPGTLALWLAGPILAAAIAAVQAVHRTGRGRAVWAALATFVALATGLGAAHVRVLPFAHLFAAVVLGWQISRLWHRVDRRWTLLRRVATKAGLMFVLGPGLWLLPLVIAGPRNPDESAARMAQATAECDLRRALPVLNDANGIGAAPRLIASVVGLGPELLFRTPHAVLAAPYHRDQDGVMAVYRLFTSTDDAEAGAMAARRGVDLILVCGVALERGICAEPDGSCAAPPSGRTTLVDRLSNGQPPAWAAPVDLPDAGRLRLYRVLPSEAAPNPGDGSAAPGAAAPGAAGPGAAGPGAAGH